MGDLRDDLAAAYAQADAECRRPAEASASKCLLHPCPCGGHGFPYPPALGGEH